MFVILRCLSQFIKPDRYGIAGDIYRGWTRGSADNQTALSRLDRALSGKYVLLLGL